MRRGWVNLVGGLLLTVGGLFAARDVGMQVAGVFDGADGQLTWSALIAGLFIAGTICWWLLVGRSQQPTVLRGAIAGALTGILAYPVVIAIAAIFQRAPPGTGFVERLLVILEVSAFALATTGFAAIFVMAIAGAICALIMRRLYPPLREASSSNIRLLRALGVGLGALALVLLAFFVWLTLLPLDRGTLADARTTGSAMSHDQAVAAYEQVRAAEGTQPLHARCESKLFTHGSKVAEAIVFLHGVTNCPAQADELAPMLFELGYNVYVPRLPGHGEADQMTFALVPLKAEDYVATTEQAIEIGRGLGDQVIVMGLSAGGALTMWGGQNRADLQHTIAMAPFLGPNVVPTWANRAATNLLLLLPNMMLTWNPLEPLGPPDMYYAYPRVPTRALAQFMRIGEVVADSARTTPPEALGLGVMLNEADFAVNNALARNIVERWRSHGRGVDLKVLPVSMRLLHDLIDPRQVDANTELVHKLLLEMLETRPR